MELSDKSWTLKATIFATLISEVIAAIHIRVYKLPLFRLVAFADSLTNFWTHTICQVESFPTHGPKFIGRVSLRSFAEHQPPDFYFLVIEPKLMTTPQGGIPWGPE